MSRTYDRSAGDLPSTAYDPVDRRPSTAYDPAAGRRPSTAYDPAAGRRRIHVAVG